MSTVDKQVLVERAAANRVPIIEDATFADLHFAGPQPAAKAFDRNGDILLCSSLTKTVAPGLRTGWVHAGRHVGQIRALKRVSSIGQPEIVQETVARYLDSGGLARHLRRLRATFRCLVDTYAQAIRDYFPPETQITLPTGGFLLWVRLPKGYDGAAVVEHAVSLDVGLAPGSMFSAQAAGTDFLRVNCGRLWTPNSQQTWQEIGLILKRQR